MDRLREYIERNIDKKIPEPTKPHSGIRVVPTLKELSVITDNPMISEQAKQDLAKLLENRPDLCRVILQIVNETSSIIGNCIAERALQLRYAWASYKLENIFVYQHTFPNMMEEPINFLGYGPYLKIPRNFRLGLLIHLDFHVKDIADGVLSNVSVGNLWCGYVKDEDVKVSHGTCVLVP